MEVAVALQSIFASVSKLALPPEQTALRAVGSTVTDVMAVVRKTSVPFSKSGAQTTQSLESGFPSVPPTLPLLTSFGVFGNLQLAQPPRVFVRTIGSIFNWSMQSAPKGTLARIKMTMAVTRRHAHLVVVVQIKHFLRITSH